jgi:hypothetical protein
LKIRILVGAVVAFAALGLGAAPAAAAGGGTNCNGTVNGGTINSNVTVNTNGVCILNGVTVNGNVAVGKKAYFEAQGSTINGNVSGMGSLTLYIWGHSTVNGNVSALQTAQVFVYNSNVTKSLAGLNKVAPGYGHFQVCGSTVGSEIGAFSMGPDILIGGGTTDCAGNTAGTEILAANNTVNSELYVIGNSVTNAGGDIGVYNNLVTLTGGGDGEVHGNNAPQGDLFCSGNSAPFNGSGNGTVGDVEGGQCSASTITGVDADD